MAESGRFVETPSHLGSSFWGRSLVRLDNVGCSVRWRFSWAPFCCSVASSGRLLFSTRLIRSYSKRGVRKDLKGGSVCTTGLVSSSCEAIFSVCGLKMGGTPPCLLLLVAEIPRFRLVAGSARQGV